MELRVSSRPCLLSSAVALLDGQEHYANTQTPALQTHVPMVASALLSSPTTYVPAHLSSLGKPANKTLMSAMPTPRLARMVAVASMRLVGTGASVPWSTQANTVRHATCPAILHHALMEGPASRKETPAMSALVYQVLMGKTATSILTTVQVMNAIMEEPA